MLSPIDLDKVIFVDVDQIVRTDLKELIDLDLQGLPYGYTPMGDNNEDLKDFRFWKMGYWEQFLWGLPDHIREMLIVFCNCFFCCLSLWGVLIDWPQCGACRRLGSVLPDGCRGTSSPYS